MVYYLIIISCILYLLWEHMWATSCLLGMWSECGCILHQTIIHWL